MNGIDHAKEVCVNLAQRNEILAWQLLRQIQEDFLTGNHLTSLPLAWTKLEALRSFERHWILLLDVPLEQESEASRNGFLEEHLLLYEGEQS